MNKIILAGSEGLIGRTLFEHLQNEYEIIKLDLKLGHDLSEIDIVWREIRKLENENPIALVNLFGLNPQPEDDESSAYDICGEKVLEYLRVNSYAVFNICQAYARIINKGSIINFASTYGIVSPNPNLYSWGFVKHPGYIMSKSAIIGMTKWLAVHFAPRIRVNAIAPGGIENDQSEEFKRRYAKLTPMDRMMRKEEIVGPVRFLISNDSSYITGHTLVVDGGWTIW